MKAPALHAKPELADGTGCSTINCVIQIAVAPRVKGYF